MARALARQQRQYNAGGEHRVLGLGQRGSLVMRRSSLAIGTALALAAAAAACTGGNGGAGVAGISPAAGSGDGTLGQNLAGESCRGVPRSGASALPGEPAPLDVLCGAG